MTSRNQPQYDFLSGGTPADASYDASFRATQAIRPDIGNEELRAQIHKLQYEIDSLKQEREVTTLRHQEDLRLVQSKADADYKRAQASESTSHAALSKHESLVSELKQTEDRAAAEKSELERKLRLSKEETQSLQEQIEEALSEASTRERHFQHSLNELEAKYKSTEQTLDQVQVDRDEKAIALQRTAQKLSEQDDQVGVLEKEIMRLKTQAGDVDDLAVIKRELSEQVAHIQKLEAANTDQRIELKQFRKQQKSVEVVEEEKHALEAKIRIVDDLRRQLNEAELQKQLLEDERKSWTSYLESFTEEDGLVQFDDPEALAKAYVQERIERASLTDQLGKLSPELITKDEHIQRLEAEILRLKADADKPKAENEGSDSKLRGRLERQRTLALKEVEYLRAQLKTFDVEESEFQPDKYDESKTARIKELEDLVDQYRNEVQSLQDDVSATGKRPEAQVASGIKRRREDAEDERIGELSRRTRTLQNELAEANNTKTVLAKELEAQKSQLKSMKDSSRTRILELRANPTSEAEAVKMSTLNALRAENAALLNEVEEKNSKSSSKTKQVPQATLERLRNELEGKDAALADKEKHMDRFKKIFANKSKEFRQAVASMLGWNLDFLPNDRVRVTSIFYPGISEEEGGEGKNSIVFDGSKGTMKVSGGPQSAFAQEIREKIEFWVDERKEIPCFLAACTMEFWEKSTRAQRA